MKKNKIRFNNKVQVKYYYKNLPINYFYKNTLKKNVKKEGYINYLIFILFLIFIFIILF
jgi:hypothetical protein